ncbi:hypothetical protein Ancab_003161 [Ancistrocladus abbreviatus]
MHLHHKQTSRKKETTLARKTMIAATMDEEEGRPFAETPTWAIATVITIMVAFGALFNHSLELFGKWLDRTKRKSLVAALDNIKDELMVFGFLSLLMSHWTIIVAKICVGASDDGSRFYPCANVRIKPRMKDPMAIEESVIPGNFNDSKPKKDNEIQWREFCPEGYESFASYESLEQLHRLLFILGVTHVCYSFFTVALAIMKIYSWRSWEDEAKSMVDDVFQEHPKASPAKARTIWVTTFILRRTSHPWSQHGILVWLLCFIRQFWSSINKSDYIALRLGFISTHELPLTYDFHNYMLRSMDEEFCVIVGISIPLWIYAILCIFLDFHGSPIYFWISFLPAILILLIGTKLHHIVVKLALEITDSCLSMENHQLKLRDDLFWFGKPWLLSRLIQFISFQHAFEMATFLWSFWEIQEASCFMRNNSFMVIRLTFGVVSQFWCSFTTFPRSVIIAEMGSRFKRTVISENVRMSLVGWKGRVEARCGSPSASHHTSGSTPTTPQVSRRDMRD